MLGPSERPERVLEKAFGIVEKGVYQIAIAARICSEPGAGLFD
jgi:hypothetical protein